MGLSEPDMNEQVRVYVTVCIYRVVYVYNVCVSTLKIDKENEERRL